MTDESGEVSDLLRRAATGDAEALRQLFSRYRDRLKRMVHLRLSRRLSGRVDDSDVVQEAYLDVCQKNCPKLLKEYLLDPVRLPIPKNSRYNHDWLIPWLLHREAQELIDGKKTELNK